MMPKKEKNRKYITEVIKLFTSKEKHHRFLDFIESPKRYDDFLDELLNDPRNLNSNCLIEIPNNKQSPEIILSQLQKLGAGKKAYVVSLDWDADGKFGDLQDIIFSETGNSIGTIIYCVESSLGYYEDHESCRYILQAVSKK
jgi:hypothetical protein